MIFIIIKDTRSYSNYLSFGTTATLDRQQWKFDGNLLVNKELVLDANGVNTTRCLDLSGGLLPVIRPCNSATQTWFFC